MHLEDSSSKQVLPKRASSIDFVGYVEAVLGHAGEYPACVIRDANAPPAAGFSADAFLGSLYDDAADAEDTVPLPSNATSHAPRLAMSSTEAEDVLSSAERTDEIVLGEVILRATVTDEVAIEDILEEVYIDDAAATPPRHDAAPSSRREPLRATDALPVMRAPAPTDLPVLERTNARRGSRGRWYLGAAALFVLGGLGGAAAVSRGSSARATATISTARVTAMGAIGATAARLRERLVPPSPPTSPVQATEGRWTAADPGSRGLRGPPDLPRAGHGTAADPGGARKVAPPPAKVPVVTFESLPKAR